MLGIADEEGEPVQTTLELYIQARLVSLVPFTCHLLITVFRVYQEYTHAPIATPLVLKGINSHQHILKF